MSRVHTVEPVCGSCQSTMSERADDWFCPRCAAYGRNVGIITPTEPMHPAFRQQLREDPTIAVGMHLDFQDYEDDTVQSMGEVTEYHSTTDRYEIVTDLEHPFDETVRYISHERLLETLWVPDGYNDVMPKEAVLALI